MEKYELVALVDAIRRENSTAREQLHSLFQQGLHFFFQREFREFHAEESSEGFVNHCLDATIMAVQRGDLLQPEHLPGLVRRIMRDYKGQTPANAAAVHKLAPVCLDATRKALAHASKNERSILRAYYVLDESPEDICQAAGISLGELRQTIIDARSRFAVQRKGPGTAGGWPSEGEQKIA